MTRGIWLILALLMALPLGCRNKDTLKPCTGQSFAAEVVQAQEGTLLVEVTDAGNSDFAVGAKVEISKDTVSAARGRICAHNACGKGDGNPAGKAEGVFYL